MRVITAAKSPACTEDVIWYKTNKREIGGCWELNPGP